MTRTGKPCCPACSPQALTLDPHEQIRAIVRDKGWAVTGVGAENPYAIGFGYTVGLESLGRPELIVFANDVQAQAKILNAVAEKTARRTTWERRFLVDAGPHKVQLRPVLDQWRLTHALMAVDYWEDQPFRLWQVRLPRPDGTFTRSGVCCTPPCQPLLDRDEPWQPIEHSTGPPSTDVLWHRAVDESGGWEGRWEKLGGRRVGRETFEVCNVPFLADDVGFGDRVTARRERSGRTVIHEVTDRSDHATVRIDARGVDDAQRDAVEDVLDVVADDARVVWECSHWSVPHWTIAVPAGALAWVEEQLYPLRRDALADYTVTRRPVS